MTFDSDTRAAQFDALIDFAKGSQVPTGFGYLDASGTVDSSRPVELWITCRMTHVFSLASLMGDLEANVLATHGVKALATYFYDQQYSGWFSAIGHDADNVQIVDGTKMAYAHAFMVLAASSAKIAGIEGAADLLDLALSVQDEFWWEGDQAKVCERYDREFVECEKYRGVNANMHTVESYLAAYDATDERQWLNRAVAILNWVVEEASKNNWRVPEHFDENWNVLPDYNRDRPKDPFRPFGFTPGHGFEWARLALHAGAQLARSAEKVPHWMLEGALELFDRAVADGWNADGAPGFVYTIDQNGRPVARERMHWVACEAIGAAVTLARALEGNEGFAAGDAERAKDLKARAEAWWEYCESYLIEQPGRWWHELDENNQPSTVTWPGKPDAYHVAQMLLLPELPLAPTFARAIKEAIA